MEKDNENSEQELTRKFMMFEQQIRLIQEQLQAVEQATLDLGSLNLGLDELVGKTNSEILSPVGRGIYAKSKLLSEELIVDIGGKNFVKKSIPETKKIVEEQIKKLNEIKNDLEGEMNKINTELTNIFMEHQNHSGHSHECNCKEGEECECKNNDGECDCGDDCECEEEEN